MLLTLAMSFGAVIGCSIDLSRPNVVGNGVNKSEQRTVTDFERISIYGVGIVTVSKSEVPSLTVRTEENMLPYVKSEVQDGTLRVGVGDGSYQWHGYPEMDVTVNGLRSVEMSGQTTANASGMEGDEFEVKVAGQSSLTVSGAVESQTLIFSGQSSYSAADLDCRKTTIRCSGQCHLVVRASDELDIEASGDCTIEYLGNPTKKSIKTSGSSRVVQRESQETIAPTETE